MSIHQERQLHLKYIFYFLNLGEMFLSLLIALNDQFLITWNIFISRKMQMPFRPRIYCGLISINFVFYDMLLCSNIRCTKNQSHVLFISLWDINKIKHVEIELKVKRGKIFLLASVLLQWVPDFNYIDYILQFLSERERERRQIVDTSIPFSYFIHQIDWFIRWKTNWYLQVWKISDNYFTDIFHTSKCTLLRQRKIHLRSSCYALIVHKLHNLFQLVFCFYF